MAPARRAAWTFAVALGLATAGCGGEDAAPPAADVPSELFDTVAPGDVGGSTPEDTHVAADTASTDVGAVEVDVADAGDGEAQDDALDVVVGDVASDVSEPVFDTPVVWFVHLSDTHVEDGTGRPATQLSYLLEVALPAIAPVAAIHTGDLVDDGGEDTQWAAYSAVVAAAPAYPDYLEIVGNHDKKNEGADRWLAHALTGVAGEGFTGQRFFDTAAGRVRFVWVDTSDSPWNPTNVVGFFGEEQRDAVLALPSGEAPIALTVVAGHHPMTGLGAMSLLGSGDRIREVLAATGAAAYLCGHVHEPEVAPLDDTLVVQAPSLGKRGTVWQETGFAIVAFEGTRPVAQMVEIDADTDPPVAWPVVLPLRPLDTGETFPAGTAIPVRALAFAPGSGLAVDARIDGGPWVPLTGDGAGRFEGRLPERWQPGGATVDVRARAEGREHVTSVRVSVDS